MAYVVLAAWLIQSVAGVVLLVGWLRHGRRGPVAVLSHVALGLAGLASWVAFLATGSVVPAWAAFALMTIGNTIGDRMLVQRWRRTSGESNGFWHDYGQVVNAALRGGLPAPVVFHALFSGVVYFTCLGVCIGATLA